MSLPHADWLDSVDPAFSLFLQEYSTSIYNLHTIIQKKGPQIRIEMVISFYVLLDEAKRELARLILHFVTICICILLNHATYRATMYLPSVFYDSAKSPPIFIGKISYFF